VENDPDLHVARRELIEVYRELGPQWIHDALDEGRALLTRDHRTQSSRELFRILERDALNPANLTIETEDQARAALARTPGDLYARLRLSEILLEKGSSGPSLEQARILLEVDRSLYPAQLVAGYALLAEGNLKGARSAFKRSVDQVKHRVEGHLGLARTYIAERRFQPAKRELDGTIKNYAPDSWELHLELVRLYLLLEDAAKLDKALTRAEEFISALRSEIEDVSPDTTEGETEEEARQKREEAERKRAELGLLLARREAETFYYRGRLALLSRDPEAARSRFLAIDERAPGSPRARFGLALVAVAEDNPQEALQHFQESVRSAAGRDVEIEVEALRSLIVLGTRTRQFDVVRDSYQSLLADKRQVEASSALATAFLDQNRGFEAIRHLQLGLRQNPRNPDLRASLGEAYHRNGDLRRATRELRIAVKGDPSLRRVYELLSDIFIASGQYQEAIKTLQRELWLERETHDVYRKLADLYFRTGSLTQAEKHVEKALKTEPDNPDVLAMKAGILIAKEAVEPAEAVLLRAASVIRPDDRRRLVMISTLLLGIDRPRRVLDLLGDGSGTGELDPSTPAQVITLRATALLTLDQTPRARAMIESYLALHPPRAGESGLPLLLAACFLEEGDLDRAQDAALTGFVTEDERAEVRLFFEACRSRTEILGTLARSLALGLALRAEPSLRPAAAAHLERVARAFPRVALPSLLHSSVLVQAGRLDEARTVLQNQIRFTPGYLPLYFALAKVHLAKDEPSAALAVFEEAEAINPTSSELYRLKAMAALDELAQAEDRDGKRTARDVSRERLSLRVAERNLYQSLELDPDQPQVRLTLGSILVRLERFQEAFLELRKAIRLDPTDARAYAELREILPKLPAAAKAASELADEMIGRFPDRPEGYLVRARIAQQEGRTAEALAIYRHTLDLDPFSAAARSGLASLVLAEGRIDETVRYLEDAVMCDPGRWRDAKQLAQILDERAGPDDKEELSRALAAYELCHTFYPNDESVIKRLLLFYLERNQVERAQKLAQRAIRTFPGDPSILTVMGWASLLEGRLEEADRTLRRALESSPDDPEIHYRLGYVLEQRGIKDDAQKEYRQALELAGAVDFAGRKDCEVRLDELTNKKGRTRRRPGDRSPAGPDG
jgi:tetratricopeptide (TPR) repeat protein